MLKRGDKRVFCRLFNGNTPLTKIRKIYSWQATKEIKDNNLLQEDEYTLVPKLVKQYKAFFGKLVKVGKEKKYVILYFNNDKDLFNAVTKSTPNEALGEGLMIKCQDEIIGMDGKFKKFERTSPKDKKFTKADTIQQTNNDDAVSNSEDDHFSDALDNSEDIVQTAKTTPKLVGPTSQNIISQKEINKYDEMNKEFSERLNGKEGSSQKTPIIIETQEEEDNRPGAKTIKKRLVVAGKISKK